MIKTLKYKLYFYKTSSGKEVITDFIDNLEDNLKRKIKTGVDILEEYGLILLRTKWLKKINKFPDIYELRITGKKQIRLLFIQYRELVFLCVHIFFKKTEKTPMKELKLAIKRAKEFI